MRPTRRRLAAWIASFAILLAALAPTLAQALATGADRAAPWGEICSASAAQSGAQVPPGGDGESPHGVKHCPWCAGSGQHFLLPWTPPAFPLAAAAQGTPVDFSHHPPHRIRDRGTPQPRAPPAHS